MDIISGKYQLRVGGRIHIVTYISINNGIKVIVTVEQWVSINTREMVDFPVP